MFEESVDPLLKRRHPPEWARVGQKRLGCKPQYVAGWDGSACVGLKGM